MLKKSASGVLVSLRGSTYRRVRLASSLTAALFGIRRVSARQRWAGEKSSLFEHSEPVVTSPPYGRFQQHFVHKWSVSAAC
jgi:hypothetical protein